MKKNFLQISKTFRNNKVEQDSKKKKNRRFREQKGKSVIHIR